MFRKTFLYIFGVLLASQAYAQSYTPDFDLLGRDTVRVINTAVPFLMISPDARSGAMGDAGAAISPDANSTHWNVAKLPFSDRDYAFSVSYTPWLRKLINDMSISYLSGYTKLRKQEAIGFSLLYFNLGSIQFRDNNGNPTQEFRPQEFAIGGYYSRKLSENLGVGMAMRFIHSNLTGNLSDNGTTGKSGNAFAVNMNFYYKSREFSLSGRRTSFALGGGVFNLGNKVSYTNTDQRDYIPVDLRIGGAITTIFDQYNKFTFTVDLNKLMVPSPPVYYTDTNGVRTIARGKDPNRSLLNGVFTSFADAPDGLKEELREWTINSGAEYWYGNGEQDLFAVRAGFFYESKYKGNRKYITLGFGVRYETFGLDFAYLVPIKQNNPLAETLRFTLQFNFNSKKTKEDIRS